MSQRLKLFIPSVFIIYSYYCDLLFILVIAIYLFVLFLPIFFIVLYYMCRQHRYHRV